MELKKHITDERTGIGYTLCGDYYLPDLALPEQEYYDLGRFGRAKFRYLQKCHKEERLLLMKKPTEPKPHRQMIVTGIAVRLGML